jgi:hypothetical protein
MTDKERIAYMQECNWKSANQYWRELYLKSREQLANLKKQLDELEK